MRHPFQSVGLADPVSPPKGNPPLRGGKDLAEDVLKTFFSACDSAMKQARGDAVGLDGDTKSISVARAKLIWAALQQARIFAVGPMLYAQALNSADRHTCELAGFDYDGEVTAEEDSKKLIDVYKQYTQLNAFPAPMPFDCVYLGYGAQLALSYEQAMTRVSQETLDNLLGHYSASSGSIHLFGHILAQMGESQYAWTVIRIQGDNVSGVAFVDTFQGGPDAEYSGPWVQPMTLDAWVLPMLIEGINEKISVTEHVPGLSLKLTKKAFEKAHKIPPGVLPIPKPYYEVKLKDSFFKEAMSKFPKLTRNWSHRWDVRGHECLKYARGTLPIDLKVESRLRKRGYRVYTTGSIPQEDLDKLSVRGIKLRDPDEWIALLSYHREPHIKGPAGKPYVPAIRSL